MAKRTRRGGGTAWWTVGAIVLAAVVVWWWFHAGRVEAPAPPSIQTGVPALVEPRDEHGHDEIAPDEKADLQRIIRERGAATPGR